MCFGHPSFVSIKSRGNFQALPRQPFKQDTHRTQFLFLLFESKVIQTEVTRSLSVRPAGLDMKVVLKWLCSQIVKVCSCCSSLFPCFLQPHVLRSHDFCPTDNREYASSYSLFLFYIRSVWLSVCREATTDAIKMILNALFLKGKTVMLLFELYLRVQEYPGPDFFGDLCFAHEKHDVPALSNLLERLQWKVGWRS